MLVAIQSLLVPHGLAADHELTHVIPVRSSRVHSTLPTLSSRAHVRPYSRDPAWPFASDPTYTRRVRG